MKLKNILSAFCLLAAMVSCSMEDDVLNEVASEIQKQELNPDREAILSFHLDANDLLTKATADNKESAKDDKETKLNNCVLALMQGEAVLAVVTSTNIANDGKVKDADKESDVTFLTKVRSGLSVIAIVNVADPKAYQNATTREGLNQVVAIDPNGTECLVKQGEAEIKFTDGFGSPSTTDAPTLNVEIPVTQLAAKIELSEFNVKYAEGSVQKEKPVTLTSVSFENLNTKSYVFDEHALESNSKSFDELNQSSKGSEDPICSVYSYANTNTESPVQMTLTFRIGEESSMQAETVVKTYLINRKGLTTSLEGKEEGKDKGVERGYLYRVKVNMTVNTHTVDTDVICYTNDWVHDEVAVDMTEVK